MPDNIIHVDFSKPSKPERLEVPWDAVRNFVFSFGYNPDDKKDLYKFIYQAFDIIVQDDIE
tara:strand:- start:2134 stop:2316 length:183 start_codon:yes stop_codon:yes gene_type:complete